MKLLWKHPMINWPSHMNVMSQKCECRIFRCFFMDQLNFCGTHRNVRHDQINCHYWKLNYIIFHWGWADSDLYVCQWDFHAFAVLHVKWLVWEVPRQSIFVSLGKSPPYAFYIWRLVASGKSQAVNCLP